MKYTVYLLVPYCEYEVEARSGLEAMCSVSAPPEFDLGDTHFWHVVDKDGIPSHHDHEGDI